MQRSSSFLPCVLSVYFTYLYKNTICLYKKKRKSFSSHLKQTSSKSFLGKLQQYDAFIFYTETLPHVEKKFILMNLLSVYSYSGFIPYFANNCFTIQQQESRQKKCSNDETCRGKSWKHVVKTSQSVTTSNSTPDKKEKNKRVCIIVTMRKALRKLQQIFVSSSWLGLKI